jgi:membrane protein implicated in regulation of membrane protease activity
VTFLAIAAICSVGALVSMVLGDLVDLDSTHDHSFGWLFSLQSLFLFGTGYGAAGAIAQTIGLPPIVTGLVAGIALAYVGYYVSASLRKQESDSTPTEWDLVGAPAIVTHRIAPGFAGQVRALNKRGHITYITAQAAEPLEESALVKVVNVVGNQAIVEKANDVGIEEA